MLWLCIIPNVSLLKGCTNLVSIVIDWKHASRWSRKIAQRGFPLDNRLAEEMQKAKNSCFDQIT